MFWKLPGISRNGIARFVLLLRVHATTGPFIGLIYICLFVLICTNVCNVITFIFSFTEYLTAFCIQNEKDYPNAKEVNSAFTQQITYARVKVSRRAKLVETGDE